VLNVLDEVSDEEIESDINDNTEDSREAETMRFILEESGNYDNYFSYINGIPLSELSAEALVNEINELVSLLDNANLKGEESLNFREKLVQHLNEIALQSNNPTTKTKNGKRNKATRRQKKESSESTTVPVSETGEEVKRPRKNKGKANSLSEKVEQLEEDFESQKKEVRKKGKSSKTKKTTKVERYENNLDELVTQMLNDQDEFLFYEQFEQSSTDVVKKSTKKRKFEVEATDSQQDKNPFDQLGEGVVCNL
jgi:hypothetical protein